ncbi:WD40/YVTN/BNR-like repeat-containing protein [Chryseobacterium arachidis]|uniref:WD40/YVTN/BNR-like repeat-containing protein n=1 Tax=Chryseobacterium arachidis TaxID=1416778 RepID=UPI0036175D27
MMMYFFLNENVGWAAKGGNGAVFKTTNGGANWIQQTVSTATNQYYRNIEFLNENVGFLGTLNNNFYKTVDGGNSWQRVDNISPYPQAICGLDCVGTSTVYGCGAWFIRLISSNQQTAAIPGNILICRAMRMLW